MVVKIKERYLLVRASLDINMGVRDPFLWFRTETTRRPRGPNALGEKVTGDRNHVYEI